MLEIDASTSDLQMDFFSLLSCKQFKTFSPFPHQNVTIEILSFILDKIFILVLFSVALCSLRTPFSDFPAHGPGMYTLLLGIHEVAVVVR